MRGVLAIVFLVTLAGCLGANPSKEPSSATVPDAWSLVFQEPLLVGSQGDAESSLLVGPDGTVLVCSHGGFWQPSPLWVSQDDGQTFVRNDPRPNPLVSGDCDLAITDDGRWAMVFDTIASATVAVSDDRGATWQIQFLSALPIAVDRPWIAAAGNTFYMTYSDVMAAEPALQMFARSEDGLVWTDHTPINVAEPPDKIQAVIGKLLVSDEGQTIHVPLARSNINTGGPTYLDLAVSRDAGASWAIENVYGPFDTGLVLPSATWAGDRLYYVVSIPNGTDYDIHVTWNDGNGWAKPALAAPAVDLPGVVGPWIDGRPDGSATIAWLGHVEAGWSAYAARVNITADGLATSGAVVLAPPTDRPQTVHEFLMVDHDDAGRAYVAWVMDTDDSCDPAPNPAEGRGSQCVWLAIEA